MITYLGYIETFNHLEGMVYFSFFKIGSVEDLVTLGVGIGRLTTHFKELEAKGLPQIHFIEHTHKHNVNSHVALGWKSHPFTDFFTRIKFYDQEIQRVGKLKKHYWNVIKKYGHIEAL